MPGRPYHDSGPMVTINISLPRPYRQWLDAQGDNRSATIRALIDQARKRQKRELDQREDEEMGESRWTGAIPRS